MPPFRGWASKKIPVLKTRAIKKPQRLKKSLRLPRKSFMREFWSSLSITETCELL
jgi:hypothetical protein